MGKINNSVICILLSTIIAGCVNVDLNEGIGANAGVKELLYLSYMHEQLGTKRIDLSQNGRCPGTKLLNAINVESRVDKRVLMEMQGEFYITPKTLNGSVVKYLNEKFIESGLSVDKIKGKIINVSITDATLEATHICKGAIKLKIEIPEISYSNVYGGTESSPSCSNAIAYSIHLAITDFLQDPVFQKYVRCE
jgi:hypothetical protein